MDVNNTLADATLIFLECSSVLNATDETNSFLICTLLSICFFLMIF